MAFPSEIYTHVTDRITADPQPIFTEIKEKFARAMQLGSNEERVIHEFCNRMQIPSDKIASEDFSAFMRILNLSKLLKNPNKMRGEGPATGVSWDEKQETQEVKRPVPVFRYQPFPLA